MGNELPEALAAPRLGLVLGAGGARGLAHIGVLKVLGRQGIDFDLVVGASMGSLVGAAYAAELPMEQLERLVVEVRAWQLVRLGRGGAGLLDRAGLASALRGVFGSRTFESLARPFATVALDLGSGELVVLRQGELVPALLAATAIPLVFPPVRIDGAWLVDGGVLNGLPVSVARTLGAERVVAVDADIHAPQPLRGRLATRLVATLRTRLLREPFDLPGRRQIVGRWLDCILARHPPSEQADVVIRPSFGRMTSNHFHLRARSIALGEAAARQALPEILALAPAAPTRTAPAVRPN